MTGMKTYSLRGRNAVVTGASSGIGLEIARHLAGNGVHLLLGAHPAERDALERIAVELQQTHGIRAWTFVCDLGAADGPQSLFEEADRGAGPGVTPGRLQERFPRIFFRLLNSG